MVRELPTIYISGILKRFNYQAGRMPRNTRITFFINRDRGLVHDVNHARPIFVESKVEPKEPFSVQTGQAHVKDLRV